MATWLWEDVAGTPFEEVINLLPPHLNLLWFHLRGMGIPTHNGLIHYAKEWPQVVFEVVTGILGEKWWFEKAERADWMSKNISIWIFWLIFWHPKNPESLRSTPIHSRKRKGILNHPTFPIVTSIFCVTEGAVLTIAIGRYLNVFWWCLRCICIIVCIGGDPGL